MSSSAGKGSGPPAAQLPRMTLTDPCGTDSSPVPEEAWLRVDRVEAEIYIERDM